jgi:hypothetical protein
MLGGGRWPSSLWAVEAKVITQAVTFRQDGTEMRGFMAYDDGGKGKRPGVLVVHEWWGLPVSPRNGP